MRASEKRGWLLHWARVELNNELKKNDGWNFRATGVLG